MAIQERGLGKGLELLLGPQGLDSIPIGVLDEPKKALNSFHNAMITSIPTIALHPNKNQPRKCFDNTSLEELAMSIQSQGVIQPIIVRPLKRQDNTRYEIVAGERRWRAAKLIGLKEIPVYIKDFSDDETLTVALVENLQREDLNPIEEATAIYRLLKKLAISQDVLAMKLGKSRSSLTNSLRLLKLSEGIQGYIQKGLVTPGHARALLALSDKCLQEVLCKAILNQNLSVRDAEAAVVYWKKKGFFPSSIEREVTHNIKKSTKVKTVFIKKILSQLRSVVHPKITMAGTESMGRITVPYESKEQLLLLIQRLGIKDKV